jgi:3-methyl-2-oxobutanoate hydroxymethyltransferase
MLTCYDASFARVCEKAGVDILLIGDSLGMTVQGAETTLAVTLSDMVYHTKAVATGCKKTFLLADLPFGAYQVSPEQAFTNAVALLAAGAQMVKVEGGSVMVETVHFLSERGVPVCAHVGLTPQSVHQFGGFRVQGRDRDEAERICTDAKSLADAGAGMLVIEAVPSALAGRITKVVGIPTIGIGAGVGTDGQVLVLQDILGLSPRAPQFARNFLVGQEGIEAAIRAYVQAVKTGAFPAPENTYDTQTA